MSIILGPEWFLGVGSLLEFLTMIMVFCIGYYALRVFRLSKASKYFYLSFAFFSIGIAYLAKALSNILIFLEASRTEVLFIKLQNIVLLRNAGLIAYMALILISYVTLVALSLKIKDKKVLSL